MCKKTIILSILCLAAAGIAVVAISLPVKRHKLPERSIRHMPRIASVRRQQMPIIEFMWKTGLAERPLTIAATRGTPDKSLPRLLKAKAEKERRAYNRMGEVLLAMVRARKSQLAPSPEEINREQKISRALEQARTAMLACEYLSMLAETTPTAKLLIPSEEEARAKKAALETQAGKLSRRLLALAATGNYKSPQTAAAYTATLASLDKTAGELALLDLLL